MSSMCDRFIITYNGEIYNHLLIRKLIEKEKKLNWRGTSDTETLIEAISCFGLDKTLQLIRGMFAFCLFDKKTKSIFLVRDRLGEKPLYFLNFKSQFFAFASELSAFNQIRAFKPEINKDAVSCYFKRGWIAAPLSVWRNVTKILPGNVVKLEINKYGKYKLKESKKYWDCSTVSIYNQQNKFKGNFDESAVHLEKLLLEVLESKSFRCAFRRVFVWRHRSVSNCSFNAEIVTKE